MALKIDKNFDYKKELLDGNEIFVRDFLKVNVENWCKFRKIINVGLDPDNLKSSNPIEKEIKDAYVELAKTHYLIVKHLGILKISLGEFEKNLQELGGLYVARSIKEFYFFVGTILDNFARLIYIVNDVGAAFEKNKHGNFVRHWIDWNDVKRKRYYGYKGIFENKNVNEMVHLRNIFTHSWDIIMVNNNGILSIPEKHRKERMNPIWFYKHEEKEFKAKYRGRYIPILKMIEDDYKSIEKFQNEIFKKLYRDVKKFEKNNNLEIC